ncbi:MAG: thermonuclease family protein [Pseudomonadota bacterium]
MVHGGYDINQAFVYGQTLLYSDLLAAPIFHLSITIICVMIAKTLVNIVVFLALSGAVAHARESFYGTVKKVIDGDSLLITACGRNIEVRLYGIDAPEYNQPFGEDAKKFAKHWIGGQRVLVQPLYLDSYKRTVAVITQNDRVLNRDLTRAGLAWVYPRYCRQEVCKKWTELEKVAREGREGLWFGSKPISPWKWKRQGQGT